MSGLYIDPHPRRPAKVYAVCNKYPSFHNPFFQLLPLLACHARLFSNSDSTDGGLGKVRHDGGQGGHLDVELPRGILSDAGVEADDLADTLKGGGLDSESLSRDEPVDTLAARGSGQGARVSLEAASLPQVDKLGENKRGGLGLGAGLGNLPDLAEDGLQEGRGTSRAIGGGGGLSLPESGRRSCHGRGGGGSAVDNNINVGSNNRNFLLG